MPHIYSNPAREQEAHALPDVLITQFTAHEVAETMEDDIHDFMKRNSFQLANMNAQVRERMLDTMVAELGIEGGWMWAYCFPGCLPESGWFGPFTSFEQAKRDAIDLSSVYA